MADPRPPTRDELAKVFTNQRVLRAFEKLFDLIPSDLIVLQDGISSATIIGETANAKSNEALSLLSRLVEAIEVLAYAPMYQPQEPEDDLAPKPELGTLSQQQSDSVEITGGSVAADLTTTRSTLIASTVTLADGSAAALGTLANAPIAGNPTKWIPIDDNGTIRYIPSW